MKEIRRSTFREIKSSFGRFMAILSIIALGVGFFSGLKVAKKAMVNTVEGYLDRHAFYDFRLLSTLGFEDGDVDFLRSREDVEAAEGAVSMDILYETEDGKRGTVKAYSLTETVNTVKLVAGRLPQADNECVVDSNLFGGTAVGTVISLSEDNAPDTMDCFRHTSYTIVGTVQSPLYIQYERGNTSLGTGRLDGFVCLMRDGFDMDFDTEIYVRFSQYNPLYGEEYETYIEEKKIIWEELARDAAQRRYQSVLAKAQEELAGGRQEFEEKKAEGEEELADADRTLAEARQELADGEQALADAARELEDAGRTLKDKEKELADGRQTLAEKEKELADGEAKLAEGEQAWKDNESRINSGWSSLNSRKEQLQQQRSALEEKSAQVEENAAGLEEKSAQIEENASALEEKSAQVEENAAALEEKSTQVEENAAALEEKSAQLEAAAAMGQLTPEVLEAGRQEIEAGRQQIEAYRQEIEAGRQQIETYRQEIEAGWQQIEAYRQEIEAGRRQIEAYRQEIESGRQLLASYDGQIAGAESQLRAASAELSKAKGELDAAAQELADGRQAIEDSKNELADGEKAIADAKREISEAKETLAEKETELEEARQEMADGEKEYADALEEFNQKIAEGEEELADAEAKIADIKEPDTYVLGRDTNIGYVCFENDSNIVEGIANLFPAFFFLVAALVCITTMNRMVEEQRTQIGVLKALGYGNGTIMSKYMIYSGLAAVLGCVSGFLLGTWGFPEVIWFVYGIMYRADSISYVFDLRLAVISMAVSLLCSVGATWLSCRVELGCNAAQLMRPKAPRAGKRVFLERIPFLWKRLSFLRKVSVRNIFRYKKRLFMMVVGISGCTALLVTGFGINDSIADVAVQQFREIQTYDVSVSLKEAADAELTRRLEELSEPGIEDFLFVMEKSVDIVTQQGVKSVYLVAGDGEEILRYLDMHTRSGGQIAYPGPREGVISRSLSEQYGIKTGDSVVLRTGDMQSLTVTVTAVMENYIYNYVYISEETWQQAMGAEPDRRTAYVNLASDADAHRISAALMKLENVASVTVNEDFMSRIGSMLESLNIIVLVVIICAAGLAFIVLYNLTNINITERVREIATVKVLGFYKKETASYVFRENIILTVLGMLPGLFLGRVLHAVVMNEIQVDMMSFDVYVRPASYLYSALLTFVFAWFVNRVMGRKLENISMTESLKSVD